MTDDQPLDPVSHRQISALGDLVRQFDSSRIQYWLFGGWAVDFYAGRITRVHDDIDIAIWLSELPEIRQVLDDGGWRHTPDDDEDGGTAFERESVRLELTYLAGNGGGRIFTPLAQGNAYWSEGAFGNTCRDFTGLSVRVIEFAALRDAKATARSEPEDAAKDRADSRTLADVEG